MNILDARFRVVTPAFVGGASDSDPAEIRLSTIKGVLRFWFRAALWSEFGNYSKLFDAEARLFGSAGRKGSGQAAALMSLRDVRLEQRQRPVQDFDRHPGIKYLSYGVIEAQPRDEKGNRPPPILRNHILDGQSQQFTVRFLFRPGVDDPQQLGCWLVKSLVAFGLFGGIGARSRKGFGSLSLESVDWAGRRVWEVARDRRTLIGQIQSFVAKLSPLSGDLPDHTAFSRQSQIILTAAQRDPWALLDKVGQEIIRYRSYGLRRGNEYVLPGGGPAEQNFRWDHDLAFEAVQGRRVRQHPRRVVFGLPHNYFFRTQRRSVSVKPSSHDRRASPLLIHVQPCGAEYTAVLSFLPAVFLPSGEQIVVNRDAVPSNPDWSVISTLLKRFQGAQEVAMP